MHAYKLLAIEARVYHLWSSRGENFDNRNSEDPTQRLWKGDLKQTYGHLADLLKFPIPLKDHLSHLWIAILR